MSSLRSPTALFLALTIAPAVILAWLGWRSTAPLVDELRRAAANEVERAASDVSQWVPAAIDAELARRRERLAAAAAAAATLFPTSPPGHALSTLERDLGGGALRLRAADGAALVPAGPRAIAFDDLPEWGHFRRFRANAPSRATPTRLAPSFESPTLQALALAEAATTPASAAAATMALAAIPWLDLVRAGPRVCELLTTTDAGRARLADAAREGLLDAVPATAAGRERWFAAAGARTDPARALRVRDEAGDRLVRLRADVAGGAFLELLLDADDVLAELRAHPGSAAPTFDDIRVELTATARVAPLRVDTPSRAVVAFDTSIGPVQVAASHLRIAAIERQATTQRVWTGVGIATLLALSCAGAALVRRALHREHRARVLRDEFIANVSHELKTPLTSLRMHAEMLAGDANGAPLDAATRVRYAAVVDAEGARLSALVEDLLDFAALERGRRRLEPEPVDLGAAARRLAASWQPLAARDGVTLRVDVRDAADPHALADPTALSRILTNLLQNAFRHGRPPRAAASSNVTLVAGPGPRVEVRDDGPGVAVADRERVFERFARGAQSHDRPGVGLGLALSRELARACGGDLTCTDTGAETVFALTLPPLPLLAAEDDR